MIRTNALDVIARMIDSPIQVHGSEESASKGQLRRMLSQLPWALEYALIQYLYKIRKEWFSQGKAPNNPPVVCANANFNPNSSTDYTNVEPYYIGPSYIIEYAFSDVFNKKFLQCGILGNNRGISQSVEDWMSKFGLYETSDDNPDSHFAERAFVVNVLVPAYGIDALSSILPQKLFDKYSYQVDFYIDTPKGKVVVEVDGREYHDPVKIGKDRFEYELKRQNRVQSLGHMVFRYPARRILQKPDSVIEEIKENIPIIGSGQKTLFDSRKTFASDHEEITNEFTEFNIVLEYCKWFRPMQLALLLALVRSGSNDRFRIVERNSPPGLLYLSLIDLALLINQACRLYDIDLALPKSIVILIQDGEKESEAPNIILEKYFTAVFKGPDGFHPLENFLPFTISQKTNELGSIDRIELIIDLKREGRIPLLPEGPAYPDILGCESANISTLRARLNAMSLDRPGPRNTLRPKNLEKKLLDYFARRFLRIPSLYHHYDAERPKKEQRQYELVRRVLQGESVLGIMPTARGKSVAFQLPAMLLPGGALIISPLRALMRDQLEDLRCRRGFNSVESIRYDMRGDEKDKALDDFIKGYTNLLYVSPERLQQIDFSEILANAASTVHISFLAIDEAHCVSEWGHDFRLSYLHIPMFLKKLEDMQNEILCPILGLTATASPPVRRDICAILRFSANDVRNGGNLVAEANIDRTELSFSVHHIKGESYPEDRQMELCKVLTGLLPRALSYNHSFSWEEFSNGETESTGAIFCIYAKPQGQTSWQDGVGAVRDSILSQQIIEDEKLRIYAANSPGFCPVCFRDNVLTYAIRNVPKGQRDDNDTSDDGAYVCSIGHYFDKPLFHSDWNKYVSKTQFDFKDKQFPLLVSTKAFGMGVDHRYLRFIIHYGLSSSIEAYYQEVGRAGRDKSHAHCALLVRPPHEQCLEMILEDKNLSEGEIEDVALPKCMKGSYFNKRKCPLEIGLPEPCDFSRQLRMILDYYVKPDGFAKGCAEFWTELTALKPDEESRVFRKIYGGGIAGDRRLQKTQNQLFRLQQLGIVRRFLLKYMSRGNHFDVTFNVWLNKTINTDELLENLRKALIKIIMAPDEEADPAVMRRNQDWVEKKLSEVFNDSVIRNHKNPTQDIVELAVLTLFKEVRRYVLRMRLTSFKRLLLYVNSNDQCRRKELLGAMTAQEHHTDTYACNFCDSGSCVPDLHFKQKKATSAPESGQHDDIFAGQEDAMRKEDLGRLDWALQEAINQNLVGAFGQKAVARLEFDPDNPMSNLAAAESYARNPDPELKRSAHGFFRNFAKITNIERKNSEMAWRGYSGYKAFDPTGAIRAFAESESALEDLEHLSILDTDAENTDLKDIERYALKSVLYAKQFKDTTNSILADFDLQEALSEW